MPRRASQTLIQNFKNLIQPAVCKKKKKHTNLYCLQMLSIIRVGPILLNFTTSESSRFYIRSNTKLNVT